MSDLQDAEGLVGELRAWPGAGSYGALLTRAADLISSQAGRLSQSSDEIGQLTFVLAVMAACAEEQRDTLCMALVSQASKRQAAEEENGRLREALKNTRGAISMWIGDVEQGLKPTVASLQDALDEIRSALSKTEGV